MADKKQADCEKCQHFMYCRIRQQTERKSKLFGEFLSLFPDTPVVSFKVSECTKFKPWETGEMTSEETDVPE